MLVINAMKVPDALVDAVRCGAWQAPADPDLYVEVFGEAPDVPEFYDIPRLISENQGWLAISREDFACESRTADNLGLSVERSVVIAGLGPDMPVVLDYRRSLDNPRVLYLLGDQPRWVEVAPHFEGLLGRLNLCRATIRRLGGPRWR